jgi:hypothetical protein|nr:MAG TPA: hypothetical protein [Caudoviricetes sp.]
MAERRMFSKRVIGSARFLKMPISTQCLYFHLGLNADDDGIVEAYTTIKQIGATEDDLKVLVAKGFCTVLNEDLVTYITDWRENNKVRADRKIDSIYKDLLLQIVPDADVQQMANRADRKPRVETGDVPGTSPGPHRLGKGRLDKDSIDKDSYHTHIGGKLKCGKLNNVYLTQEQLDELDRLIPSQAQKYINKFGWYKSIKNIESYDDYAWIRGWMDEDEAIAKERRKQEAERWDAIVEEEANEKL